MAEGRAQRSPRAAIVYNPLKVDVERLRAAVEQAEAAYDWAESMWFETTALDAGQGQTASALRRGAAVVIAVGGDGTVRAVGEALSHSGVPLGLVPQGTGNLLARNLVLTLTSIEESIETAFGGEDRRLDLGMVEIVRDNGDKETHGFLVMAGLGIDAKMIKNTNTKLKKAVGWLAYVDGIARSVPELKPVKLRYRVDQGPERSMSAHTIIVGNCGALPGGFLLMPDAKPDDGLLDIAALRPRGPFGWAKVWRKVAWENGVLRKSVIGRKIIDLSKDVKDVAYFRGRQLAMSIEHPEEFQLDGDEFGEAKAVHAWVEPGALLVKMPALGA